MQDSQAPRQSISPPMTSVDDRISHENHAIYLTAHPSATLPAQPRALLISMICLALLFSGSISFAWLKKDTTSTQMAELSIVAKKADQPGDRPAEGEGAVTSTNQKNQTTQASNTAESSTVKPPTDSGSASSSQLPPITGTDTPVPSNTNSTPETQQGTTVQPNTTSLAPSFTFSIGSWNTLYSNSAANIDAGTRYTAGKAVVIAYQEMRESASRRALRDALLCGSCQFQGEVGDYTTNGWTNVALPVVWQKNSFQKISAGSVVAAPSYITSNKYFTWVKLRHTATQKEFYVVNVHPVAGAETAGKPSTDSTRVATYKEYMNNLVATLTSLKRSNIPIFVVGDYNVNYRYDSVVKNSMFPYYQLGQLGFRSNWDVLQLKSVLSTQGTTKYSSTIIDYIYFWQRSDVKANAEWISSYYYGSDHHLITTNFTITQ